MKFVSIEDEYKRKPQLKREDVNFIKEWMSKQPHLPEISDVQVALFLNSCYFKLEATKTCVENFYNLRAHCPELFSGKDPSTATMRQAMNTVSTVVFPKLHPKNYLMVMIKLHDTNPEFFVINDILRRIDAYITLFGVRKGLQDGHVIIFDSKGLQLGHILKLNLLSLKKYLYFVQEAMPIRLKEVHIVNVSAFTEKFLSLVMPFLKKELVEIIYMHRDIENFYKFIPRERLPVDYGGVEDDFEDLHRGSVKEIEEFAEFIVDEEKLKSDETKRQGKRVDFDNLFGVEGSFKKLELD